LPYLLHHFSNAIFDKKEGLINCPKGLIIGVKSGYKKEDKLL